MDDELRKKGLGEFWGLGQQAYHHSQKKPDNRKISELTVDEFRKLLAENSKYQMHEENRKRQEQRVSLGLFPDGISGDY